MKWPNKNEREYLEIEGFIKAYAKSPERHHFEVISKGECPDNIVRDLDTGEEYGIELTSVYLNDRSIPDMHINDHEGIVPIPYNEEEIEQYKKRIIDKIKKKASKARKHYDTSRPLILAIYVNEYISIYFNKPELEVFVKEYEEIFYMMSPFVEVVFWNLSNEDIFQVRVK